MQFSTLWYRLNKRLAGSRLGRRVGPSVLHPADRLLERLSGGRWTLTRILSGVTPVWLTSIGAKSGQPRTVPLIGLQDGERVVLLASNWGQAHYPAWYYNVSANPAVELRIDNITRRYTARQAAGQEYDHYWERAVAFYPGYANYKITAGERVIPIFILDPL